MEHTAPIPTQKEALQAFVTLASYYERTPTLDIPKALLDSLDQPLRDLIRNTLQMEEEEFTINTESENDLLDSDWDAIDASELAETLEFEDF